MLRAIKKILCPVDAYDFQPEIADYAMTLAKAFGARITVLYVMEPLPPRYYGESYYGEGGSIPLAFAEEEVAMRRAETKLTEILSNYFGPCTDRGEILLGQPADQIGKIAEEYSADMIIMASHGRSILGRVIYGSVTSKVLANTTIPVLVIQPSKTQ